MKRLTLVLVALLLPLVAQAAPTRYQIQADTTTIMVGDMLQVLGRADIDSAAVDTFYGPAPRFQTGLVVPAGQAITVTRVNGDTINVDSLTLSELAKMTAPAGASIVLSAVDVDSLLGAGKATGLWTFNAGLDVPPGQQATLRKIALDTLNTYAITKIVVLAPLSSYSRLDSLKYHLANIQRINVDSLYFGGAPIVGFSGGASAGKHVFWSYTRTDTLNTDSLTISGKMKALAGSVSQFAAITPDSILGNPKVTGTPIFSAGYSALLANINSGTIDGTVIGGTTTAAGTFTTAKGDSVRGTAISAQRSWVDTARTNTKFAAGLTVPAGQRSTTAASDVDSLIGGTLVPAGVRLTAAAIDVDSLIGAHVSTGLATFNAGLTVPAGQTLTAARTNSDTVRTDSLTVRPGGKARFAGATISDLGTVTTVDINGGTVDGTVIGGTTPAAGTFTDLTATTANLGTVTSGTVYTNSLLDSRGTYITWKDTTILSSVKNLIAVNLHDPAQVWSYDAFRAAEKNTSLNRTDHVRVPDVAVLAISTAGDTLRWLDAANPSVTPVRFYAYEPNNGFSLIGSQAAINTVGFLDGKIYTTPNLRVIDELSDEAWIYNTSGTYKWSLKLSQRNAGSTSQWTLMNASPAIVNNTVNAVAAIRSPWKLDRHRDQLGRQIQYWAAATTGGVSVSSYDAAGTLSIYDGAVDTMKAVFLTPYGRYLSLAGNSVTNRDLWRFKRSIFAITGDAYTTDATYSDSSISTGATKLRWGPATIGAGMAALPGASGSGRNSSRVFAIADSGLEVLDLLTNDETNGSKQEINNRYVSPVMVGNVMAAWSPADTTMVGGIVGIAISNSANVTRTATVAGPLSHAWNFNGSNDAVTVPDHDSLTFVAGQPMSISCWVNAAAVTNRTIISKRTATTGSVQFEWKLYFDASGYLTIDEEDIGGAGVIGRVWATAFPTGAWHYVVATSSGSTSDTGLALWVDGVRVDNSTHTGGPFTGMANSTASVVIGAYTFPSGAYGAFFSGSLTPPVIARTVLSPQQIKTAYDIGLHMIQSPWADTLFTAPVVKVKVQPYTGDVLLVHAGSVEVRDRFGALVDTFQCTGCGTLADGDFFRIAGVDSLGGGIAFGGSTGQRRIIPDPRVHDLAQARYNFTPYEIPTPAVVDSAGFGNFWTLNDAAAALANVGRKVISVMRGTYPSATLGATAAGMTISGAGDSSTVFDGGANSLDGLTVNAPYVTLENIGARTTPGGGGTKDAFVFSGSYFNGRNLRALGSDDDCFDFEAVDSSTLVNATAGRCDDEGFFFQGSSGTNNVFQFRTKDQAGTSVITQSGDNHNVFSGRLDGAYTDGGTGNVWAAIDTTSY